MLTQHNWHVITSYFAACRCHCCCCCHGCRTLRSLVKLLASCPRMIAAAAAAAADLLPGLPSHHAWGLNAQLCAPPVTPLCIVANLVVCTKANPMRNGTVLAGLLGQDLLGPKSLLARHGGDVASLLRDVAYSKGCDFFGSALKCSLPTSAAQTACAAYATHEAPSWSVECEASRCVRLLATARRLCTMHTQSHTFE